MIIAVDGYEANVRNRVGIGRYAYEILVHMYSLLYRQRNPEHRIRVYLTSKPLRDMPPETFWWKYYVRGPSILWTFIGLPLALATDKPKAAVVFSPTHYVPRFISMPRVMSIMDTSYLLFPNMFKKKDLFQLVHWTKYSVVKSQKICTISQYSKNAIMRAYGLPENKVIVTYPGLSMLPRKDKLTDTDFIHKYQLSKHFILSVGTIQPRKNYSRLIEAFSQFLLTNRQKFGEIQLVIIGKKGWLYEKILEAPRRYGVEEKVKFLDFVPDNELPVFYKHALCFALPSLYEGFGLPVLEAMAYGCPVVVSNVSSLPEIARKAGIYVDPKSVTSITKGLLAAVRQRNLLQGKYRKKEGLNQVRKFTWERAARETLQVLEEVGKGKT
ncbi:hypothetical protein A2Z00_02305 [Candidatus Gottesmanbacteria bacterium RBG_13_45_10]|uniref:Glycosyl transferase family 1 domain-containing protein n=1 Tax=Candidatus Gottesmanbacteria bacterium RBG_13_45_10 TaxID=1798370 RepID=A0A1F5ZGN3_9BACT|nr:MAG: hypothetical protein A2Z00_02305 [Candidatus Gottesmanbacteria bacterium RBG_13_45_10]